MSSSESDYNFVSEDEDEDEEEQIYRLVYDMYTADDKTETEEEVQIPPSSEPAPVCLESDAERRTHEVDTLNPVKCLTVDNTKGPHMDALNDIRGISVLEATVEEKPWRKPGADISDYFNYGFDEESWSTYCKKQSKLRAANRKLFTKTTVQKGHTRHEEKEHCSAYPSLGSPSILASRQSSTSTDVTGGHPGPSSRVEGRPCLSVEENRTQVVTEMFPEEDRIIPYQLPHPSNVNSPFAFTPSPPFHYRRGAHPPSPLVTLDSGQSKVLDEPSTSLAPPQCSSGASSSIPRSKSSRAGLIDTARAWEYYILQEKNEKDGGRSRERGHDKDSKRGRDRNRESCSSSHNSEEERMRHRDTTERGHKRHTSERFTGEKEEWHKERKCRDKNKGWQKSSCSSRRDRGEDRDSQSRRKHKKAKRKRKDKKTNKMFSADSERKLKSD